MDFSCLYLSVFLSICLSASLSLSAFQICLVYSHTYSLYHHDIINATAISGNQISYKSEIVDQAQTAAGSHWGISPIENPSGACKLEPHPLKSPFAVVNLEDVTDGDSRMFLQRMDQWPNTDRQACVNSAMMLETWGLLKREPHRGQSQSHSVDGFRGRTRDDVSQEHDSSIIGAIFKVPVFALFQWVLVLYYGIGLCNLGSLH